MSLLSNKNTPSGSLADVDDEDETTQTTDEIDRVKKREDERLAKEEADRLQQEAEAAKLKAEEDATFRIWTSVNGKKSPEAKIASYGNGIVTLESRNGKRTKVPVEKLIQADKDFIAKWRKER
jgi:hypothetical protein